MNLKKIISLVLVSIMVLSVFSTTAFAKNESAYVPSYDSETPIIILHGIGQNETYILDEEGNRKLDSEGGYLTGWPLEIDLPAFLKRVIPALLLSIVTQRDCGLTEAMSKGAYDLLYAVHKDNEGNYETDVEVPCYKCPMSEMPAEVRQKCYSMIPVERCGEIVGEDKLYYFGYDSLGDIETTTKNLHEYITEVVIPQTGAKQVNICPISLGGTLAVSYMEMFKEDYPLIKKMVYVVPAVDGSDIVGDILIGRLSTENNEALYYDLIKYLMGDTYTSYFINMLLRIVPEKVMKSAVVGLSEGVVEAAVINCTQLWALCPSEYYEEARAKWIADEAHSVIAKKVDAFMQARANFAKNQAAFVNGGGKVYDIVCYGAEFFPITRNYKNENTDGIIQSESTSMGATFAPLGKTLGADYKAKGTYCSNPHHNHLSPEKDVDPTTGLFPCTTWYFKGQLHENLDGNDVCLGLATELLTDDNMIDVYSNEAAYPQFNGARNVKNINRMINEYKAYDKSKLTSSEKEAIEKAIDEIDKEKSNTVINAESWQKAEANLENALVSAGIREKEEVSLFESSLTTITRSMNRTLNTILDK